MNSAPFTGIVVCFNDSRYLRQCLERLGFCEELVVVDLGSTDDSLTIARQMGARIVHHEWVPTVEMVRAFAVNQAQNEWVVFMDPDLMFPQGVEIDVQRLIAENPQAGVIGIPYQNYFMGNPLRYGRWGGIRTYPAIMHRDRVILSSSVHRGIALKRGFTSVKVGDGAEKILIHHWADSLEHFLDKQSRYYYQEAILSYNDGKRFSWYSVIVPPLKGVFQSLIRQRGYMDGRIGLFLSLFWGWYLLNCSMALRHMEKSIAEKGFVATGIPYRGLNDRIVRLLFRRFLRLSPTQSRNTSESVPNLAGDRQMEWTYIASRIGRYADENSYVLDFGCGTGMLSLAAASIGADVLAIDLIPQQFETGYPNIEFRQADVMTLDEQRHRFDLILNCSTIEHVGLSGRYNVVTEAPDRDLEAMEKLRRLLKTGGYMLMTLPVGRDAVIRPLHRVYGTKRLPRLLEGYRVVESSFWRKDERNIWLLCSQDEAMAEVANDHYYALGFMVLRGT
jgi:glycosyltransferase involved in cell wall biosynthesis/ubiquinone/menaquinone biosynthesis C-methylase UbiE